MANYLEVDPKIVENNFLLQEESNNVGDFEKFLRSPVDYVKDNTPWKLVKPTPGLCVKTTDSNNKKIFINVCKIDEIPEPKDIDPSELLQIWMSEDTPDYRIPLSIQDPHDELDKAGNPTVAYDVGLNTNFFKKVETNNIFKSFVLQVILEGIENKYNLELDKENFQIMKVRKCLGQLKPHRIRSEKGNYKSKRPLIQEISSSEEQTVEGKTSQKPLYRIYENKKTGVVVGEFYLPKVISYKDINLNVNENRVVLYTRNGFYQSDFFLPLTVDDSRTTSKFHLNSKILTVKMPIIGVNS